MKTVHPSAPLECYHRGLGRLDQCGGQQQGKCRPKSGLYAERNGEGAVYLYHQWDQYVPQQKDDDIGWEIIRVMLVPALAAMDATTGRFEKFREHCAFAARRTASAQCAGQRRGERALV